MGLVLLDKKRAYDFTRKPLILFGAEGRNRTDIGLPLLDFESSASTSFTTPAEKEASSLGVVSLSSLKSTRSRSFSL